MSDFFTVEKLGPQQSLTPEGFLIVRAVPLARTGPQLYSDKELPLTGDSSGRIVIDRDPDQVFRPETIASLQGKPVTLDHPDDDVVPDNYHEFAVGHVINPRQGTGTMDNLLLGDLLIHKPEAIKAIRDKALRELSVGYTADYEETGRGRGRQLNIKCNHLALLRDGRCGPVCRIGDANYFAMVCTCDKEEKPEHEKKFCEKCLLEKSKAEKPEHEHKTFDEDYPVKLEIELTQWDGLRQLLNLWRYIRNSANGGHSFKLEADREDYEGEASDRPEVYIDGDGADKVGRILLNGEDVTEPADEKDKNDTKDWSFVNVAGEQHKQRPKRSKHVHLHL